MRTRFAWQHIVAVLGIVVGLSLAPGALTVQAASLQPGSGAQAFAQEATATPVPSEEAPSGDDAESGVPSTEVPVTVEPEVETPTTEPVVTTEPTVAESPETAEPQVATEVASVTAEASVEVDAAAEPTYVFPNPAIKGTVNVAKFACTGRTTTTFDVDVFAAAASLPSGPGACRPTSGVFTFVFLGSLPNRSQLAVQNAGSIDLPAGTYSVKDESSGTQTTITISEGQVANIMVFGPAAVPQPTITPGDGTVSVAVVACTNVTSTTFDIDTFSAAASQVDCTNTSAKVTFYMVGDGTADYVQRVFSGSGAISLRPGVYEIVVEDTHTHRFITVASNQVLSMVIMKPLAVAGGAVSGAGEDGDPTSAPVATFVPADEAEDVSSAGASSSGGGRSVEGGGIAIGTDDLTSSRVRTSNASASHSVDSGASEAAAVNAAPEVTMLPKAGSGPASHSALPMVWVLLSTSCMLFTFARTMWRRGR